MSISTTNEDKTVIKLNLLDKFFSQRSGIDFREYAQDWRDADGIRAYRQDYYESITRPRKVYNILMYIAGNWGVNDKDLERAAPNAFSGRLSFDGDKLNYCVGQNFPTEYRHAVNAVLLKAIRYAYEREQANYGLYDVSYSDYKDMLKRAGITRGMMADYGL